MTESYENQRQFQRKYLCIQNEAEELQSQGASIELRTTSLFGRTIGRAILKDISLGGAGLLISSKHSTPDLFELIYQNHSAKVKVVYRRPLTARLTFLGVRWYETERHKRVGMIRLLRQLKKSYKLDPSPHNEDLNAE